MKRRIAALRLQTSRGAAAVEFALVAPLFILILLFMVDAGRIIFVQTTLQNAAAQGARAASLGQTLANVTTVARAAAPGAVSMAGSGEANITVTLVTACPVPSDPASTAMSKVTTSATYTWTSPIGLIQSFNPAETRPGTMTISATSEWLCSAS